PVPSPCPAGAPASGTTPSPPGRRHGRFTPRRTYPLGTSGVSLRAAAAFFRDRPLRRGTLTKCVEPLKVRTYGRLPGVDPHGNDGTRHSQQDGGRHLRLQPPSHRHGRQRLHHTRSAEPHPRPLPHHGAAQITSAQGEGRPHAHQGERQGGPHRRRRHQRLHRQRAGHPQGGRQPQQQRPLLPSYGISHRHHRGGGGGAAPSAPNQSAPGPGPGGSGGGPTGGAGGGGGGG